VGVVDADGGDGGADLPQGMKRIKRRRRKPEEWYFQDCGRPDVCVETPRGPAQFRNGYYATRSWKKAKWLLDTFEDLLAKNQHPGWFPRGTNID
jgi:hypothetical protein